MVFHVSIFFASLHTIYCLISFDLSHILCYYNLVFEYLCYPARESGPFIQDTRKFKFGN